MAEEAKKAEDATTAVQYMCDNGLGLILMGTPASLGKLLSSVTTYPSSVKLTPIVAKGDHFQTTYDAMEHMAFVSKHIYHTHSPHGAVMQEGHSVAMAMGNSHMSDLNRITSFTHDKYEMCRVQDVANVATQLKYPRLRLAACHRTVMQQLVPETLRPPNRETVEEVMPQKIKDHTDVGDRCFLCAVPWLAVVPPVFAICQVNRENVTPNRLLLTTDLSPMIEEFRGLLVDQERTTMATLFLEPGLYGSSTHGVVTP